MLSIGIADGKEISTHVRLGFKSLMKLPKSLDLFHEGAFYHFRFL